MSALNGFIVITYAIEVRVIYDTPMAVINVIGAFSSIGGVMVGSYYSYINW